MLDDELIISSNNPITKSNLTITRSKTGFFLFNYNEELKDQSKYDKLSDEEKHRIQNCLEYLDNTKHINSKDGSYQKEEHITACVNPMDGQVYVLKTINIRPLFVLVEDKEQARKMLFLADNSFRVKHQKIEKMNWKDKRK
jgi:hypothetical protein